MLILLISKPADHCSMRTRSAEFGHDIGVEQILLHLKSTTGRRRALRLSGTRFSARAPGASNRALRLGRAARCSRFHSSIGTNTAASTPRRVTTCGPFLRVVSNNSLKRALASCTCHEANFHLSLSLYLSIYLYHTD